MTIYSLTLCAEDYEALKTRLIHKDGCERAAYLLCRKARAGIDPWEREAHERFLVTRVIPVPDEDVVESTPVRVSWRTRSFIRALKEAADYDQVVSVVHTHPNGQLAFSPLDDARPPARRAEPQWRRHACA